MDELIRFGIVSFAHYHANFWADAIVRSTDATLVGVWDDDPERGSEAAERYGTRYWRDLSSLLSECDAVGITSETVNHAPLIEEAAAAGVHVLCEKPMATTLEDCDRIVDAITATGVLFMQNFPKRYDPVNQELVDLVQRGELGDVAMARIRHGHFHGLDTAFAQQWFVDPSRSGGGTLLDEGSHAADFLLWLLGEPQSVSATISDKVLGLPVEDTAIAVFSFASGAMAEVSASWSFIAAEQSVEVFGTRGSVSLSGVDLASRDFSSLPYLKTFSYGEERGTWHGSNTVPFFKQGNFHQQGPIHFLKCLVGDAEPIVGIYEARKSMEMLIAAYRAAETGEPARINYCPTTP